MKTPLNRCSLVLASFVAFAANAVTITPDTELVIAPDAPHTVRFAAREMSSLLEGCFGRTPPTVTSPTDGKGHIYIGASKWAAAAGVLADGLDRDAFRLRCVGKDVYVVGRDDPEVDPDQRMDLGEWNQHYERASLFGVYEILERYAGVRMYFPGELGTVTPKCRAFEVPDGLDEVFKPTFTVRHYSVFLDGEYFEGPKMFKVNPVKNVNYLRLRMQTSMIPCCHGQSLLCLLDRFGDTHPEYFLLEKGKRRTDPSVAMPGMICLTSGVWDEIYKDCEAYLTGGSRGYKWSKSAFRYGKYCDIMCQDGLRKCECENCRKKLGKGRYWASELVWSNTCAIARRLTEKGIPGYVTQMAYTSYRGVPQSVDIPENVLVMLAQRGPWTLYEPRTLKKDLQELKEWYRKKQERKIWMWTYVNKYRFLNLPDIPIMTPRTVGKYFKMVEPYIFGAYMESDCDRFLYCHLNYAVFAHLCWHPETDVDEYVDEYHRLMFGAAAADMKEAYGIFEDKWTREIANTTVEMPDGPLANPPCEHFIWHEIYSPAVIDRLEALFNSAAAKVKEGSLEAKRVALMRRELFDPLAERARKYVAVSTPPGPRKGLVVTLDSSTKESSARRFALDGSDKRFPIRLEPFKRYRVSFNVEVDGMEPTDRGGGATALIDAGETILFPTYTAYNGTFPRSHKVYECFTGPDVNLRGHRAMLKFLILKAKGRAVFDGITVEEIPKKPGDVKPVISAAAVPMDDGWMMEVRMDRDVLRRFDFTKKIPGGFFVFKDPSGKIRKLAADKYDRRGNPGIMRRFIKRSEVAEDVKVITFELKLSYRMCDFIDIPIREGR